MRSWVKGHFTMWGYLILVAGISSDRVFGPLCVINLFIFFYIIPSDFPSCPLVLHQIQQMGIVFQQLVTLDIRKMLIYISGRRQHQQIQNPINCQHFQYQILINANIQFEQSKKQNNILFPFILFMILRRFFTLSFLTKQRFPTLHSQSFSAKKSQVEAEQTPDVEQNTEEVPVTEQVPPSQQKTPAPQKTRTHHTRERRSHNSNYRRRQHQVQIVAHQFLSMKEDLSEVQKLIQEAKAITNKDQLFQKVQELQKIAQQEVMKPLRLYEKKLNIYPQQLIKNSGLFAEDQDFKKSMRLTKNLLYQADLGQVKRFYAQEASELQKIKDREFTNQILKKVDASHRQNFYLNLLYDYSLNKTGLDRYPLQMNSFRRCLDAVLTGEFHDTNPLKFYWFCAKINPVLINEISPHVLKQFNKLIIGGKKLNKELKSLTLFYFSEQISSKLIASILKQAPSLTEAIRLWVFTLVIFSRIKNLQQTYVNKDKINFNDIFNLGEHDAFYSKYFLNDLPQTLFEKGKVNQYETYTKALKYHAQQSKRVFELNISTFESQLNLSLITNPAPVQISYSFSEDPQPLTVQYSKKITKSVNKSISEYNLIENIIKGKYESALKYYIDNIAQQKDKHTIHEYRLKGQSLFQDQSSQALYTLKQIFKDSKYIMVEDQSLTTNKLALLHSAGYTRDGYSRSSDGYSQRNQNNRQHSFRQDNFKRQPKQQPKVVQKVEEEQLHQVPATNSPKKGIFTKKVASSFCSIKQKDPEQNSTAQSGAQYENYLQTIKQIQNAVAIEAAKRAGAAVKPPSLFDFGLSITLEDVQNEFEKHLKQINQDNIASLLASTEYVPQIGELKVLIKHYFLSTTRLNIENQPIQGLNVQFTSTFGQVSKDYNQYVKTCSLMFEFPDSFYEELLADQEKKNNRHHFKRIVAHLLTFKKKISALAITKICNICSKQKMGLTLLEIINLINARQCVVSYESLKKIASSIQNFKNMQSDLISFVRKYCDRTGTQIQTQLFQPYIVNLTFTERYEALNAFLQILRQEFKPKQYKIDSKISADQNLKAQKIYKEKQTERLNKQLFEMINIVSFSLKPRTVIPSFIPELFDIYMSKKKGPMTAREYGVGLIVTSQNEAKFLDLLAKLKDDPKENNLVAFDYLIKCLSIFGRNLKDQVEKILRSSLYLKKHQLTEEQLKSFGYIFNDLDLPAAFTEYLEYVLKTQPPSNQEIKGLYYKVFNRTTDDHSKNQISGLLDYIFNPTREKDRVEYKKVKLEEERKAEILKNISSKKQEKKPEEAEQAVQVKQADKEKKKSKKEQKEQKKKLKQQKKQKKESKSAGKEPKQQKQSGALEYQTAASRQTKKQIKHLQKLGTSFSYDQNKKVVYNQKLSMRDLRKPSLVMFIESFLQKYEIKNDEDEETGKDNKFKKGKQPKQAPKSASKGGKKN